MKIYNQQFIMSKRTFDERRLKYTVGHSNKQHTMIQGTSINFCRPKRTPCLWIPSWWRHQMETFSALLAIGSGNSPITGECPAQGLMTRIFHVFFDLRLNKRVSKQWWGCWFEMPSRPLWRHCNGITIFYVLVDFINPKAEMSIYFNLLNYTFSAGN